MEQTHGVEESSHKASVKIKRFSLTTERTALARSAAAKNPSASAAHCSDAAATSLPSATATRPVYSAAIPMAAVKAAADGAMNSVMRPLSTCGEVAEAMTAPTSSVNSINDSWGFCPARRSSMCTVILLQWSIIVVVVPVLFKRVEH